MSDWQEIKVNSKILGHISAGIYRSPGGAIKELVSNAYDADATRVVITTNWPSFDFISCRDNGSGMTIDKFKRIMTQEIGDSEKRAKSDFEGKDITKLGRPIIGWLGIGMLGVAQICHEFKIISHHKETKTAFKASVCLADFLNEKVADIPPEQVLRKPIPVGRFKPDPVDYDPDKIGTYIIASDMRSAFVKKFRETSGDDALPSKFSAFLEQIHNERSIKALSDYWQMVWELSVACPVPYKDEGPFDWDKIEVKSELKKWLMNLQKSLNAYQFEVVVDGLSLRKPNQYPLVSTQVPKKEQITGKMFFVNKNLDVFGQTFKLTGYIYLQNGRALEPMELRGLLVRIRNIAIGIYDSSLFKYPKAASPRFNWLSGEIYVEEGLEFALNIDRDSFNEIHPHFVKLKEIIHNLLEKEVFPEASRGEKERTQKKQEKNQTEKQEKLLSLIREELGENFSADSTDEQLYPLTIDTDQELILQNDQSSLLPKSIRKREFILAIAHAYEISMESPIEKRRDKFYHVLQKLVESGLL